MATFLIWLCTGLSAALLTGSGPLASDSIPSGGGGEPRQHLLVPVLASNRVNDPATAEEILREGEADMVTMARGLIADPFLPQKALEGRAERITRCIACNQGCFDAIFALRPAGCL
ncbi:MAG: hypothetical protein R6T96_11495, partial [Longimicrobiales bacterium]